MKLIRSQETSTFENSSQCYGQLYDVKDPDLDLALITINGRYPDHGEIRNTQIKELAYVVAGEGAIVLEQQTYPLNKGDAILIQPNEAYYWQGNLNIIVTCRPRFDPAQHQLLSSE